jgi:hypothetical protein
MLDHFTHDLQCYDKCSSKKGDLYVGADRHVGQVNNFLISHLSTHFTQVFSRALELTATSFAPLKSGSIGGGMYEQ